MVKETLISWLCSGILLLRSCSDECLLYLIVVVPHSMMQAAVVRAERAARELEGVTFTPEITRLAATLWSGGDLESQPAWQRLSQDKRAKTLERISEMKRHREDTEVRGGGYKGRGGQCGSLARESSAVRPMVLPGSKLFLLWSFALLACLHGRPVTCVGLFGCLQLKECTFRPRVNKTSAQMMSDRAEALKALNVTAHDQLFQVCILPDCVQPRLLRSPHLLLGGVDEWLVLCGYLSFMHHHPLPTCPHPGRNPPAAENG
jgi:hypothetical protein